MADTQTEEQEVYYHGAFDRARLKTWAFWRNMAIHFSLCSVVGHWLEIPWCIFCLYVFGIYDPNSMVWVNPFYPFMVYGVGAVVCVIFLTPLKDRMLRKRKTKFGAGLEFYVVCVLACMVMEVGMGLLMKPARRSRRVPLVGQFPFALQHSSAGMVAQRFAARRLCPYLYLVCLSAGGTLDGAPAPQGDGCACPGGGCRVHRLERSAVHHVPLIEVLRLSLLAAGFSIRKGIAVCLRRSVFAQVRNTGLRWAHTVSLLLASDAEQSCPITGRPYFRLRRQAVSAGRIP